MYTALKLAASLFLLCSFVSLTQAQTDKMLIDFEGDLESFDIKTRNAQETLVKADGSQLLHVLLSGGVQRADVRLISRGWKLAAYRGVAMDISNPGPSPIAVLASITVDDQKTSAQSFVWVEPNQTETMLLTFSRNQLPQYIEQSIEGMRGLPGGHVWHWNTPDLDKLNTLTITKARPNEELQFLVDNIRAVGEYRLPTQKELKSGFFPFVDKFGQYMHADWPGRTKSQTDIDTQHQEERKDLASHPGPKHRNQYGGWTAGPQLEATGHFRTQKLDEKWWLVDPEGRLFWSQGVTGVRLSQDTRIWKRENYFEEAVKDGDFRMANLQRKFGDDWSEEATELTHTRFRSWGLNTFANWSDPELYGMAKTPYVVAMGSGVDKHMPAQLDEASFRETIRRRINAKTVAHFKNDPWCLGVFVDNELRWPRKNTAAVADTYYKVVSETLKELAPNILYLGSRIHGDGEPRAAYTAAANHCDVVSMNRYQLAIVHEDLPKGSVDKPMIIGEFHFGALDRGLLHTGLRSVSNQQQRAHAYADFVHQALENDRIVGVHWFQHTDQLVTGRGDGENYQIGFVDIVDRPYPEMIEAARRVADTLYEYRKNAVE